MERQKLNAFQGDLVTKDFNGFQLPELDDDQSGLFSIVIP